MVQSANSDSSKIINVSLFLCALFFQVFFVGPARATPRKQSSQRACFCNMKTIAGSLEMYELDYKVDPIAQFNGKLTPTFVQKMIDGGYFQSAPSHPKAFQEPSRFMNKFIDYRYLQVVGISPLRIESPLDFYGFTEDGTIFCYAHGFINPPIQGVTSAYEQLKAKGEARVEILERALKYSLEARRKQPGITYSLDYSRDNPLAIIAFLSFFWLPFTIWHLSHWRKYQIVKFAVIGFALTAAYFVTSSSSSNMLEAKRLFLKLAVFIVFIDIALYSIKVLISSNPIEVLDNRGLSLFSVMSADKIEGVKTTVEQSFNSCFLSRKVTKAVYWFFLLIVLPLVGSQIFRFDLLLAELVLVLGWFSLGAITGVTYFCFMVKTVVSQSSRESSPIKIPSLLISFLSFIVVLIVGTLLGATPRAFRTFSPTSVLLAVFSFYYGRFYGASYLSSKMIKSLY